MPGLDDGLAVAPLEPFGQLGVGDDVAAAGQRLVPGGGAVDDGGGARGDPGLLIAYDPQVLERGGTGGQFLVDRARRVGVLAPVEAAVQDGVAQGGGALSGVCLAQQPLAAGAAFRRGEHGRGVDEQLVVVAPLDDVGTARERTGGGKGAVGGGRDAQRHVARVVGGALRTEEEVPVAFPQWQWATGRLDGVGPQLGPEPPGLRGPGEHHREDGLLVVTAVLGHQLDGPVGVVGEGALQEQQPVLRPARQLAGGLHGPVTDQQIARELAVSASSRGSSPPASGAGEPLG